jgi:imidazolonepropionase-like amidohydrolase
MKELKSLTLSAIAFVFCLTASGQLITKKESTAIDNILTESSKQFKPKTYIIKNVSILTMNDPELLNNQSVLIESGIIQKIGTDIQNQEATIIDGSGKFLMPGLTDMHFHLFDGLPLKNLWILHLLINGVTTVRDLYGSPEKLILRERIRNNEVLAPTLYQSGQIINGVNDKYFAYASTAKQAREIVQTHKRAGYDFIKVYDGLTKDVYAAIVDEAKRQNIPVVGHVPDQITITEATELGQQTIEHLTGYFEWDGSQVKITTENSYAEITAKSVTWNCPTIYNHYLNGSRLGAAKVISYAETSGLLPGSLKELWKKRAKGTSKEVIEIADKYGASNFDIHKGIVLNLYNSKAKLIAGTDAGGLPFLIPGYSLHQELKLMSEFGIPTYEVLKMATINAALAMNKDTEFGTVEIGKRADLLLLNSNPLDNIENLQDKNGLMIRGIWLSEEEIKKLTDKIKLTFSK